MGVLVAKKSVVAGTIWIGKNYKSNDADVMDGNQLWDGDTDLKTMSRYALTIKGGWNGKGKGTLDPTKPSTFTGASFTIANWKGNLTLRNLVVQNATTSLACPAPYALCAYTKGSLKLDRVQVLNNTGLAGAYLYNTLSTSSPPTSIIVTNSQFTGNDGYGLAVGSNGTITVANVLAQDNSIEGIYINNRFGTGNVLLKGTITLLGNDAGGLSVRTNGRVTATHLIALSNGAITAAPGVEISAKKAVTINGSGKFKDNGTSGLEIYSSSPIAAKNLMATSNHGDGLYLWTDAPEDVQAVTLSNVNADTNDVSGIEIYADGKITLACSSAYGNDTGLYVRGTYPADPADPAAALKLQSFVSYGNTENGNIAANNIVESTICP